MEQKELIRSFIIGMVKKYIEDMDFLKGVGNQNKFAIDSLDDYVIQLERIQSQLQAVLDYNFYPEEIENTPVYRMEIVKIE